MNISITNPNFKRDTQVLKAIANVDTSYPFVIGGGSPTDTRFGRAYKDIDIFTMEPHASVETLIEILTKAGATEIVARDYTSPYGAGVTKIAEAHFRMKDAWYSAELMRVGIIDHTLANVNLVNFLVTDHFASNAVCNFIFKCEATNRVMFAGNYILSSICFKGGTPLDFKVKTINKYLPYYINGWSDDHRLLSGRAIGVTPLKVSSLPNISRSNCLRSYRVKYSNQAIQARAARTNQGDQGLSPTTTARVSHLQDGDTSFISSAGSLSQNRQNQGRVAQELQPSRGQGGRVAIEIPNTHTGNIVSDNPHLSLSIERGYRTVSWVATPYP